MASAVFVEKSKHIIHILLVKNAITRHAVKGVDPISVL
jgi:hypothetical protein